MLPLRIQVNRYGYLYFHCNFAEYGRLRSEIARKRTVFIRNIGHSNTAPFPPFARCHGFIKTKEIISVAFVLYAATFLSFFYYPSLLCVIDTN